MGPRRGISLMEILVVCVLTTLLLGTAYSLLLLAQRAWNQISARASLAINAEVALERVRRDLQDSCSPSVTVSDNALGLASARDPLTGIFLTNLPGNPRWQGYLAYYVDNQSTLRERHAPLPPAPLTPAALQALCDGSGAAVAYDVVLLTCVLSGTSASLRISCQGGAGQTETFEVDSSVLIRNGGWPGQDGPP